MRTYNTPFVVQGGDNQVDSILTQPRIERARIGGAGGGAGRGRGMRTIRDQRSSECYASRWNKRDYSPDTVLEPT